MKKVDELLETRTKIKNLLNSEANKASFFNILSTINIEILQKDSNIEDSTLDKNNFII